MEERGFEQTLSVFIYLSVSICGCIALLRLRALARRATREKLILLASLTLVWLWFTHLPNCWQVDQHLISRVP
jgi:hypothetical protein